MMTETEAHKIRGERTGAMLAAYSTYNPVLRQHCLSTITLVARIRCTEDARRVENEGKETHWIEYGWVDGSHPSMTQAWDSEEEASMNARSYAETHDTRAEYINPSPMTQKGLVPRK